MSVSRIFLIFFGVFLVTTALERSCSPGLWKNKGKCVPCTCQPKTSVSKECLENTGQCFCKRPYSGLKCTQKCHNCYFLYDSILKTIRDDVNEIIQKAKELNNVSGVVVDVKVFLELLLQISKILDMNKPMHVNDILESIEALQKLYQLVESQDKNLQMTMTLLGELNNNSSTALSEFQKLFGEINKKKDELSDKNVELEETNIAGTLKIIGDAKTDAESYVVNAKKIIESLIEILKKMSETDLTAIYSKNAEGINNTNINIQKIYDDMVTHKLFCEKNACFEDLWSLLKQNKGDLTEAMLRQKQEYYTNFSFGNITDVFLKNAEILKKALRLRNDLEQYFEKAKKLIEMFDEFNKAANELDIEKIKDEINSLDFETSFDEAQKLAETLKNIAESFNDASWILEQTKQNLTFSLELKRNATEVKNNIIKFQEDVIRTKEEILKIEEEYRKVDLLIGDINADIKMINNNTVFVDTFFPLIEGFFEDLSKTVVENNEIAKNLTDQASGLTKKLVGNTNVLKEFVDTANELKTVLKEKSLYFERADTLLQQSHDVVEKIRDISDVPEDDNFTIQLENDVKKLQKDVKSSEMRLQEGLAKLRC